MFDFLADLRVHVLLLMIVSNVRIIVKLGVTCGGSAISPSGASNRLRNRFDVGVPKLIGGLALAKLYIYE